MCGFAGVVSWDERYRVGRATLARMSAAVAHRGPDGEGFYVNHDREASAGRPHAALAFRRLAVLDPDPRSDQPFTIGGKTVVFNGELYNFRELRAELSRDFPNYQWRTAGDTEVLLRGYDCWGERCVEKFNGMFAFAVWDEAEGTLFLARDRMGQKPLYVAVQSDNAAERSAVAFASELPALLRVPWVERRVDPAAVVEYLRWGFVPTPGTIYATIHQLPPGETMRLSHRGGGRQTYYDPNRIAREADSYPVRSAKPADIKDRVRGLVVEAVQRRLVADVPLGCFLSGGIDSSVVAASMRADGRAVQTFSIGFDDPRYDERSYARRVAEHLGTDHHEFLVKPDAAADLPAVAAAFGQPFGDSSALPTWYLSRETRRHVTVALSGDGGDEFFGGYDRYRAMALSERLRRLLPREAWWLVGAAARRAGGGHPKSRRARAARFAASICLPADERYSAYLRLFDDALIDELLPAPRLAAPLAGRDSATPRPASGAAKRLPDAVVQAFVNRHGRSPMERAMGVDQSLYLPDDLLTKVDRASMAHALEVRSPFMDPDLMRYCLTHLGPRHLMRGGPKRMLREAFAADLPAWVFTRRKMGFAVPVGEWFRGPLRDMLRDNLFAADSFAASHFNVAVVRKLVEDHESGRADHGQRLYALLMLELWWKTQQNPAR